MAAVGPELDRHSPRRAQLPVAHVQYLLGDLVRLAERDVHRASIRQPPSHSLAAKAIVRELSSFLENRDVLGWVLLLTMIFFSSLAFAVLAGGTWLLGRIVANAIGGRTKASVLGPVDRALGFGFGALKGLIIVSLLFLLAALVVDVTGGGPTRRPKWMTDSRTYPLLNATSAGIGDFVDRRRRGQPVFGAKPGASMADNTSEAP